MRNTRSLAMIAVAVFVALAAVVVAARWLTSQRGGTDKVALAVVDIGLGSRLTPEMIRMVDWPANALPPGAMTDAKMLDGRVSRTSIQRGEPIMEGKLAPPGTKGGLSAVVADGKRAMTVRVNDVVGVAGFALPGTYVDILVNTQDEGAKSNTNSTKDHSISKIVLERILVLAVAQESSRDDTKPKVVNAVTLELSPDQAEMLDLARSVGTLSLVLRNQVDPKPVMTVGATKSLLLNAPPPPAPAALPEPAPAPKPKPKRRQVAVGPGEKVEMIKGVERTTHEF